MANSVVAVLALAFCMWWMPLGWFSGPSTTEHVYQIVVVDDPTRIPAGARGRQAWLKDPLVNGEPVTSSMLQASGSWRTAPMGDPWMLVCEHPSTPTSVEVRAKTLAVTAMCHPWSGSLDVSRDGVLIDSVALTSVDTREVVLDYGNDFRLARVAITLAGFALALALLRPWRGGGGLTIWLAALVVLVHSVCWLTTDVGVSLDSPGYPQSARLFADGSPAYFPPGYGFLMLAVEATGQPIGSATALVQHALVALLAVLLHRHFRRWIGEAGAFVGAFLGTALFPTLFGAQTLMSETLTCVLLAAPLLLVMQADRRARGWRAIAAGVTTAFAGITRVVPLAALLPVFVVRGLLPWRERDWRWIAATAGTAIAIVVATIAYYGVRSGHWQLSTGVGRHLYNHFVYEQKLLAPDAPATAQLRSYLDGKDPRDLPHWDAFDVTQRDQTLDGAEREQLIHRVAMEAAATASILEHLAFTSGLTWRNLSIPAAATMTVDDFSDGKHPELVQTAPVPHRIGPQMQTRGREWTEVVWPALCWLFAASAAAAFLLREGRGPWLAWVWLVWAYMFASSAVEFELPRYQVAVAPMVAMLGVGTVAVVARRLRPVRERVVDGTGVAAPAKML